MKMCGGDDKPPAAFSLSPLHFTETDCRLPTVLTSRSNSGETFSVRRRGGLSLEGVEDANPKVNPNLCVVSSLCVMCVPRFIRVGCMLGLEANIVGPRLSPLPAMIFFASSTSLLASFRLRIHAIFSNLRISVSLQAVRAEFGFHVGHVAGGVAFSSMETKVLLCV